MNIELLDGEVFKEHPVYNGYFVSNMERVVGAKGNLLNASKSSSGYMIIGFYGNKKQRTTSVHRAVIETFVGQIPENKNIDHIDGIKHNNKLSNLEMVTRSENQKRAYELGLVVGCKGTRNGNSVLADAQILEIYDMVIDGKSNDEIGEHYGVHPRYISLIRHGKRWGHLYHSHKISTIDNSDKISDKRGMILTSFRATTDEFHKAMSLLKEIEDGKVMAKDLAIKYNLHRTTISHIKRKKKWRNAWENYYQIKAATTIESMG
jgi:hypothetical protein